MGKRIDLTGQVYNRLTVVGFSHKNKWGQLMWMCECSCGKEKIVLGADVKSGNVKSCGCLQIERCTTHGCSGKTGIPEYWIYQSMKNRCTNPNNPDFKDYGARKISVCKRWLNSFENFLNDMGPKPGKNYSIDRINFDGNYEPSNCRWATAKEQNQNRRNNVNLVYQGITKCQAEWARLLKVSHPTITYHIKKGKSFPEIYEHFMNKAA